MIFSLLFFLIILFNILLPFFSFGLSFFYTFSFFRFISFSFSLLLASLQYFQPYFIFLLSFVLINDPLLSPEYIFFFSCAKLMHFLSMVFVFFIFILYFTFIYFLSFLFIIVQTFFLSFIRFYHSRQYLILASIPFFYIFCLSVIFRISFAFFCFLFLILFLSFVPSLLTYSFNSSWNLSVHTVTCLWIVFKPNLFLPYLSAIFLLDYIKE